MSVCDSCPEPGHCCRYLMLNGGNFPSRGGTIEKAEAELRADRPFGPPLPFHPLFKRSDDIWVLWCPNLDLKSGRCLDYANRPGCCSDYEPGTDRLCILHEPEGPASFGDLDFGPA